MHDRELKINVDMRLLFYEVMRRGKEEEMKKVRHAREKDEFYYWHDTGTL